MFRQRRTPCEQSAETPVYHSLAKSDPKPSSPYYDHRHGSPHRKIEEPRVYSPRAPAAASSTHSMGDQEDPVGWRRPGRNSSYEMLHDPQQQHRLQAPRPSPRPAQGLLTPPSQTEQRFHGQFHSDQQEQRPMGPLPHREQQELRSSHGQQVEQQAENGFRATVSGLEGDVSKPATTADPCLSVRARYRRQAESALTMSGSSDSTGTPNVETEGLRQLSVFERLGTGGGSGATVEAGEKKGTADDVSKLELKLYPSRGTSSVLTHLAFSSTRISFPSGGHLETNDVREANCDCSGLLILIWVTNIH